MTDKHLNKKLNKGKARKADNKRLCRELLKKGNTQREIAKILNVSLQTANTYCQEIAREIEDAHKAEVEKEQEERQKIKQRKRRVRELREETPTEEPQTPDEPKTPPKVQAKSPDEYEPPMTQEELLFLSSRYSGENLFKLLEYYNIEDISQIKPADGRNLIAKIKAKMQNQ